MAEDSLFNTEVIEKYNEELARILDKQSKLRDQKIKELQDNQAALQQFEEQYRLNIENLKQKYAIKAALESIVQLEKDANKEETENIRLSAANEEQKKRARIQSIMQDGILLANAKEKQKLKRQELADEKEQLRAAQQRLNELRRDANASPEDISEAEKTVAKKQQNISSLQNSSDSTDKLIRILESVNKTISSSASSIINIVDRNITLYSQYMGKVTARLQSIDANSGKSFSTVVDKLSTLGSSPYVSQKQLYENIDRLSSEGISYNLEERAFLASLSDKIVNSFDVGNATLTRLIRLYQEDFTQAMLGSEAWLTQIFNSMYEDTSYLKNVDDSVMSALTDVMATLDRSDALQFQYDVQKWLGAMYEVGVSSESLLSIANAINALGTGNASGFESSPSNILMNLAIARSDYSLADILTQGLTSEAVNDILKSVVELLIDIKDNTSNQATLNAYANVMGVSMADIRGFYNLQQDITELYNQTMDIETAENEVQNQLTAIIYDRTTLQEKIDNVLDNLGTSIGMTIANNTGQYIAWILGKTLVSVGSSIPGMVGSGISIAGYADLLGTLAFGAGDAFSGLDDSGSDIANKLKIKGFFNKFKNFSDGLTGDNLISFLLSTTDLSVTGNRGSNYVGVKPDYGDVTSSLSSSFSAKNIGSTENMYTNVADVIANEAAQTSGLVNLEPLSTQSGYGYDVYSSESDNEGYNEYDIFEELFYHQEHPIRVHLAYFDDEAMSQLKYDGHMQHMYDMATGLGIPVEVGGSDVATLMDGIYSVKMG